jgi:hypothetical protein
MVNVGIVRVRQVDDARRVCVQNRSKSLYRQRKIVADAEVWEPQEVSPPRAEDRQGFCRFGFADRSSFVQTNAMDAALARG